MNFDEKSDLLKNKNRLSVREVNMNKDEFVKNVMELVKTDDKEMTEKGIRIVFSLLSYRLTESEQKDVEAQLSTDLKKIWNNRVWAVNFYRISGKRLKYRHQIELMSLVENEIKRDNLNLNAEPLTKAVFHVLKDTISSGESEDIAHMLPEEVRE